MSLLEVIVILALVGLAVWAIQKLIPMPAPFQNAIYVLSVVFVVLLLLNVFFGVGPHVTLWPGRLSR